MAAVMTKQRPCHRVVPPNPPRAVPVRLRCHKGYKIQDCDVYVGHKVSNPNWTFATSKWRNIYHKVKPVSKSMQLYRKHVLAKKQLRGSLDELYGKRLGCWCRDLRNCHATVLANLVNERQRFSEFCADDAFFFKGSRSPFSNLYVCNLNFDGKMFMCLEQLRAYLLAELVSEDVVKQHILDCSTPYEACQLAKVVGLSAVSDDEEHGTTDDVLSSPLKDPILHVKRMYQIMNLKWNQCAAFRNAVQNLGGRLPVESTRSRFWGAGIDISDMPRNFKLIHVRGKNLLGWIIALVGFRHSFEQGTVSQFITMYTNGPDLPVHKGLYYLLEALPQSDRPPHPAAIDKVEEEEEDEEEEEEEEEQQEQQEPQPMLTDTPLSPNETCPPTPPYTPMSPQYPPPPYPEPETTTKPPSLLPPPPPYPSCGLPVCQEMMIPPSTFIPMTSQGCALLPRCLDDLLDEDDNAMLQARNNTAPPPPPPPPPAVTTPPPPPPPPQSIIKTAPPTRTTTTISSSIVG